MLTRRPLECVLSELKWGRQAGRQAEEKLGVWDKNTHVSSYASHHMFAWGIVGNACESLSTCVWHIDSFLECLKRWWWSLGWFYYFQPDTWHLWDLHWKFFFSLKTAAFGFKRCVAEQLELVFTDFSVGLRGAIMQQNTSTLPACPLFHKYEKISTHLFYSTVRAWPTYNTAFFSRPYHKTQYRLYQYQYFSSKLLMNTTTGQQNQMSN